MLRERMTNRPSHYKSKYKVDLSPREKEVLSLVTKGRTNAEIASALGIAFDTVKYHVSGVLGKLGVDSREEAAAYWRSYTSVGGRLGRAWNALLGVFATKTAAIAGGSLAVIAATAVVALAVALSLNGNDPSDKLSAEPSLPEPRVGTPSKLPAGGGMPLVDTGGTIFVPTTQGLGAFDPATGASGLVAGTTRGPLGASPSGQVWTKGSGPNTLARIDGMSRAVAAEIELPFPIHDTTFIFATESNVWISFWAYDTVIKVAVATNSVESSTALEKPKGATFAGGYLWVTLSRSDAVVKLDPVTMASLALISLGTARENPSCGGCVSWAYAAGDSLWAISTDPGQVTRIDTASGRVVGTLLLPGKLLPGFAAAGDGDAWVPVTRPGTVHGDLVRVDFATVSEVDRVSLGAGKGQLDSVSPQGLAMIDDTIWVATEQGEMIPVRANP